MTAPLSLDCARDATGAIRAGRPGVLYVLTDEIALLSIIVDSQGTDINAGWPKYQHDARNGNNAGAPLFACPQ